MKVKEAKRRKQKVRRKWWTKNVCTLLYAASCEKYGIREIEKHTKIWKLMPQRAFKQDCAEKNICQENIYENV